MDARVPPAASRDLQRLKRALFDVIAATVSAAGASSASPAVLQSRAIERIEAEGVPVGGEGRFGVISGLHISRSSEEPNWLIATTSLGIPFGIDTSVYVFEEQHGAWKPVLRVESNGYTEISDAQGWLTFHVVPGKPGKKPFLVTAEVTPSMASVWQALRLRVLRAGPSPDSPTVVMKRKLSYCLDEPYHVAIHPEGFSLMYLAEAVDSELAGFRGVHYLQYQLGDDGARVIHEGAVDPYNLVKAWAANERKEPAPTWHNLLRRPLWGCGLGEIRLAERAHATPPQLIAVAGCTGGHQERPSAYATLGVVDGQFRLESISASDPIPHD